MYTSIKYLLTIYYVQSTMMKKIKMPVKQSHTEAQLLGEEIPISLLYFCPQIHPKNIWVSL